VVGLPEIIHVDASKSTTTAPNAPSGLSLLAGKTICSPDRTQASNADEQDRAQVGKLAEAVQQITGDNVELAYVDQGYTGENAAQAAAKHGIQLEVVKHTEVKRGLVLLPRRWVVERSFAWAARFRRLARDYERLSKTLEGIHYFAFALLMLANLTKMLSQS
jgi:transposase